METARLLLPGFQGRDLRASVLSEDGDTTTYVLRCPTSVPIDGCGIRGEGMTAIRAPTSVQVINIDENKNTASVSCDLAGTTSAFCHAKATQTIFVKGPLPSKDLNWMDVPMTVMGPEPTKAFPSPILADETAGWSTDMVLALNIFNFVFLFCLIFFTLLRFFFPRRLTI